MNIKMIVTDLDRTLLRSDKSISDYTANILLACKRQGVLVAFATARPERSCKRFEDEIHPDAIITNGGALARAGGKTVYRASMSIETTNALLLSCLKHGNVGYITADTDNGFFVNKPVHPNDPAWIEYLPAYPVDFSQGLDCGARTIAVEIPDDTTAYEIASHFPTVDVIPFFGENWFRFADKAADKLHGVKELAVHTGIGLPHIAAFGDDYNDVEMLRACGVGIAVANAINEAKAAADHICDANDNDGVAKWLAERVLI